MIDFAQRVYSVVSAIPRGRVMTYAGVAKAIQAPRSARAVGSALARNPQLVVVPCHRVVKSDGHIGEYAGGRAAKRQLLEQEGIIFAGDYVASFVPFEISI